MKISIRSWEKSDTPSLASILSNKKILNNLRDGLPYPYTEKDALDYIIFILSSNPNNTQENIHCHSAELGYYLAEERWGKEL